MAWYVFVHKRTMSSTQLVMVESPYSGDIDRNVRYLQLCHIDCSIVRGEVPYSSHSYMTQHPRAKSMFVSDYDAKWDILTREEAIAASQLVRARCDKTVFYTDRGWSSGMKAAKIFCQTHGLPFEERTLNIPALAAKASFLTEAFCQAVVGNQAYEQYLE
jgi:hypothetical protein